MTSSRPSGFSPDAYPTRAGEAFDPRWLQTPATLNRTALAALPNAEPRWVGRMAFELLGAAALKDLSSEAAAEAFGKRLGHLVATLHRGESEQGASEWRRAYLRYWSTIQEVWLGGGLTAALGTALVINARAEAKRLGAAAVAIQAAEYPSELPLIGAARCNRSASQTAVVLDFGHTSIKRGIASFEGRALARLDVLPPLPAPAERDEAPGVVAEAIQATLAEAPPADHAVLASVASYVNPDGTLAESHSRYALLSPTPTLAFGHDGTLAACGIQPNGPRAAVIMLGTALGVGFAPPRWSLRPITPGFELRVLRTP